VLSSIQYACIQEAAISRDIKIWLCSLSGAKDISNSCDNGTIETMTFIDVGERRISCVKDGGKPRDFKQWEVLTVVACVHVPSSHDLDELIWQQDRRWPDEYLSVCRPVGEFIEHGDVDLMVLWVK
jgi:hypothetical protein